MKTTFTTTAMAMALAITGAAHAETKIRLSTYVNESDVRYQGFQHFAELVAEKTDGSVTVDIFPSSTLHGWSEGVDALQGGVSDISWINADNRLPCYVVTSLYPANVNLDQQPALDAAYSDLIREEAANVGLVPLLNSNYSYDQEWWFDGEIEDLGKLDGKLVRSIGPLVSMMIETWGGQPVFVAPKEVFQSAERGVVDGINMGVATYSSWKLWSVMPYMVNANLFYGNIIYMMNKDKFDSLTPEEQTALTEAAAETEAWLQPLYEQWVDEQVAAAVAEGGTEVTLSAEKTAELIASVSEQWKTEVDNACGPDRANTFRELMATHAN
ncbi:TRAP transporter substrate-binding protein DctP [Litoreibacter arenae]|uniref:TRAP-type C4-dicarboxylate transport system, periplasmic component n=1 Tax=Litoreibacter arenae DSM 19593 TaxID=1123360 RepID=S9QIH2_9RHOB|nr:TRAP transporter substrate-binding protein DctP [Litoreibacter arenae]EPX79383.1 TRAP-type C4-dicarboxylate transport system, periplasmic component [Litoreibacter arenae DSM 19593]